MAPKDESRTHLSSEHSESGPTAPGKKKSSSKKGPPSKVFLNSLPTHQTSKNPEACDVLDSSRPNRQRTTRGRGSIPVDYDMKHHPLDDIMWPKTAARRKTNTAKTKAGSDNSDFPIEDVRQFIQDSGTRDEDEERIQSTHGLLGESSMVDSGQRRSSCRLSQSEAPNYNMKHHPMDDIIHQDSSCQRRVRLDADCSAPRRRENICEPKASFGDQLAALEGANGSVVNKANAASIPVLEKETIERNRRRSTRTSTGEKLYDMRHHPMDNTLRPGVVAKRSEFRLRTVSIDPQRDKPKTISPTKSESEERTSLKLLRDPTPDPSANPVLQSPAPSHNESINEGPVDWDKIDDMHRKVYLLQRGAPVNGNTLPMKWGEVKQILFDEGYHVTLDDLNSREHTERLKAGYESVRIGVEAFFGAKPEKSNKKDWTLLRTEGFDIYDKKRGSKYWRHFEESIVRPSLVSHKVTGNPFMGLATADDALSSEVEGMPPENAQKDEPSFFNTLLDETLDGRREPLSQDGMQETWDAASLLLDHISEQPDVNPKMHLRGERNQSSSCKQFSTNRPFTKTDTSTLPTEKANTTHPIPNIQTIQNAPNNPPLIRYQIPPSQPPPTLKSPTAARPSKKRKRKPIPNPEISIYEDLPSRTPLVKRLASTNPASPGTDIPKENISASQGEIEVSGQGGETPRSRGQRHQPNTTNTPQGLTSLRAVVIPTAVEYHPPRSPPHRSLFGRGFLR